MLALRWAFSLCQFLGVSVQLPLGLFQPSLKLSQVSTESLPSTVVSTRRVERGELWSLAMWALLSGGPEVGAYPVHSTPWLCCSRVALRTV